MNDGYFKACMIFEKSLPIGQNSYFFLIASTEAGDVCTWQLDITDN